MNINDIRFDADLDKVASDFDLILNLISECKANYLWEGSTNLNNIESSILELLLSIEEYQKTRKESHKIA